MASKVGVSVGSAAVSLVRLVSSLSGLLVEVMLAGSRVSGGCGSAMSYFTAVVRLRVCRRNPTFLPTFSDALRNAIA